MGAADGEGYQFLRDEPASQDRFGTHTRLAGALATTIRKSFSTRVIGLIGPWGSGKSTITRLMKNALSDGNVGTSPVYVFDTWLHHGEPVRKAFLEDFLDFCSRARNGENQALLQESNAASAREMVNKATGHTTTTTTDENPRVSRGGLVILVSLALAALGVAMGGTLRRLPVVKALLEVVPEWTPALLPFLLVALPVAGVATLRFARTIGASRPIAIGFIATATAIPVWLLCLRLSWQGERLGLLMLFAISLWCIQQSARPLMQYRLTRRKALVRNSGTPKESILALLLNRSFQSKEVKITGSSLPDAVEFAKAFRFLREKTFPADIPLTVVIDNLDRLPDSEAKDTWGLLRAFFNPVNENERGDGIDVASISIGRSVAPDADVNLDIPEAEKTNRTVILVPIAASAVEAIYGTPRAAADEITAGLQAKKNPQPQTLGQAFMDKTFDVVFHLPQPLFTHWTRYLRARLLWFFRREAETNDIRLASELVDDLFRETGEVVTPRKLNSLVNLIATYWLQYADSGIRFQTVAYYCMNKATIDENIAASLNDNSCVLAAHDKDWRLALAALHFGVSRLQAREVLLSESIEEAIRGRNPQGFAEIMDSPEAREIFVRHIRELRLRLPGARDEFFNIIRVLDLDAPRSFLTREDTWNRFGDLLDRSRPWTSFLADDAEAVLKLLNNINVDKTILVSVNEAIATVPSDNSFSPDAFVKFWTEVAAEMPFLISDMPKVSVPSTGEVFISVAERLKDYDSVNPRLVPVEPVVVMATLAADFDLQPRPPNDTVEAHLSIVFGTGIQSIGPNWSPLLDAASNRLRNLYNPHKESFVPAGLENIAVPLLALVLMGRHALRSPALMRLREDNLLKLAYDESVLVGAWTTAARAATLCLLMDAPINLSQPYSPAPNRSDNPLRSELVRILPAAIDEAPAQKLLDTLTIQYGTRIGTIANEVIAALETHLGIGDNPDAF